MVNQMVKLPREHDYDLEFPEASLRLVDFSGLDLHRAVFSKADIRGACFDHAQMRCAVMEEANASGCSMLGASLIGVRGGLSMFIAANLRGAQMIHGDFHGANFTRAILSGARVHGANFAGADMRGAQIQCEGCDEATWTAAKFSASTAFSTGFDPELHGLVLWTDE